MLSGISSQLLTSLSEKLKYKEFNISTVNFVYCVSFQI